MNKETTMVWCASSYGRDWQACDIVPNFISNARQASAIGTVESVNFNGPEGKKIALTDNDEAIALFIDHFMNATNVLDISLSGDKPFKWEMTLAYDLGVPPDIRSGRIFLDFSCMLNNNSSEKLWQAFIQVHSDDNTSYAFIHPFNGWISVRDKKLPLVNCITFQTVLWANFIGSDQMRFFDKDKLKVSAVYECSPVDNPWLWLRLFENAGVLVDKHSRKTAEKQRNSIDKCFRKASILLR